MSFNIALQLYQSGEYDGIGIALGQGLVGVDWDDCCAGNDWDQDVLRQVHQLNTYTELSVSGCGLHALALGVLPSGRRKREGFEIYSEGRFFVVTGRRMTVAPESISYREKEICALHREMFGGATAASMSPRPILIPLHNWALLHRGGGGGGEEETRKALDVLTVDSRHIESPREQWTDDIVMRRLRNDRVAARYWRGLPDGMNPSRADFALACKLAFYTHGNVAQMDRLFRRSGLYGRPKHSTRRGNVDYVTYTLIRAAARQKIFWQPSKKKALNTRRGRPESEATRRVAEMDEQYPSSSAEVVAALCGLRPSHVRVIRHRMRAREVGIDRRAGP
jgi:hypothetical protein